MIHLKKRFGILVFMLIFVFAGWVHAAEIVIGFSGPLSGPAAEYGQDCVNGIDMAIKEINAAGGVTVDGQKFLFRLERMDDRFDPNQTVANARELVDKQALAIFNPIFHTTVALLKINQEECGEFIAMGYTSSPKLTEIKNDLLVVGAPLMTVYAQVYAETAWERGWRKAAMVVTQGAYGDEWRDVFGKYWRELGGKITVDRAANYYTRTDFVGPLQDAVNSKPDVMLIGGPSATTALLIEQARNMGYQGGLLIVDQAKLDSIAQMLDGTRLMENAIGTASVASIPVPVMESFNKKYQDLYRRVNTWEALLHYNSMHALARAITAAGTQDNVYAVRAAFSKALPMLGDQFPGEMYGIAPSGRIFIPAVIQAIQGGRFMPPDLYIWWTKTPQEFENVKKVSKLMIPLKPIKLKTGSIQ